MTQTEHNRQVHEEIVRELSALTLEERVQRLIECGILTKDGKLAPRYGGPTGAAPPEGPGTEQAKAS